jgi:hypothetical protein
LRTSSSSSSSHSRCCRTCCCRHSFSFARSTNVCPPPRCRCAKSFVMLFCSNTHVEIFWWKSFSVILCSSSSSKEFQASIPVLSRGLDLLNQKRNKNLLNSVRKRDTETERKRETDRQTETETERQRGALISYQSREEESDDDSLRFFWRLLLSCRLQNRPRLSNLHNLQAKICTSSSKEFQASIPRDLDLTNQKRNRKLFNSVRERERERDR